MSSIEKMGSTVLSSYASSVKVSVTDELLAVTDAIKPPTANKESPDRRSYNVSGVDYPSMASVVKSCCTIHTQSPWQRVFGSLCKGDYGMCSNAVAWFEKTVKYGRDDSNSGRSQETWCRYSTVGRSNTRQTRKERATAVSHRRS